MNNKSPELRNPCKAPSDWYLWLKGVLQGTLFKGGQQSYLISEQPGIFAFLYGMAAACGSAWRQKCPQSLRSAFIKQRKVSSGCFLIGKIRIKGTAFQDRQQGLGYFCRVQQWLLEKQTTPEQFESGFSSAKHLNEGIHFPKCSAASSCALVKQLKKLSTCLFLVPTSGHKFIYGPSETAALLLRKSWRTTAKLIRVPGAEQICEAADTKCRVFVYPLCLSE